MFILSAENGISPDSHITCFLTLILVICFLLQPSPYRKLQTHCLSPSLLPSSTFPFFLSTYHLTHYVIHIFYLLLSLTSHQDVNSTRSGNFALLTDASTVDGTVLDIVSAQFRLLSEGKETPHTVNGEPFFS